MAFWQREILLVCIKDQSLQDGTHRSLSLHVGKETIKPVSVVRNLGVLLDEELTMKQHISNVASIAFYHIRRLKKVRSILGM